jgi:hypothetical protein
MSEPLEVRTRRIGIAVASVAVIIVAVLLAGAGLGRLPATARAPVDGAPRVARGVGDTTGSGSARVLSATDEPPVLPTPSLVPTEQPTTTEEADLSHVEFDWIHAGEVVAEVRVLVLFPVRANTASGVPPTRDPNVPAYRDVGGDEKEQYQAILVEVIRWYRGEIPDVDRLLVWDLVTRGGDWGLSNVSHRMPTDRMTGGDRALVFAQEQKDVPGNRVIWSHLHAEAGRLSTPGHGVRVADVGSWYQYFDGDKVWNTQNSTVRPIADVRAEIERLAAEGE